MSTGTIELISPVAARNLEPPNAGSQVERALTKALDLERLACAHPGISARHLERALFAGARAFLLRGGKAFRARLVQSSYALTGHDPHELPLAALAAVELLHAGSLIVDDIQDDAEERRGAPALHRIMGMPLALNAGNWLYFVALESLTQLPLDGVRMLAATRAAHQCLMRCHEGQALDLGLRVSELRRAEVPPAARTTSRLKTGALMAFAARLGALVGDASVDEATLLATFGEQAGVALQMLDDLGSFVAQPRHEKALEDLRGQRVNWVWAWAVESLDPVTYKQLARQAARGEGLDEVRARLAEVVEPLGRARIHGALGSALAPLERLYGETPALSGLRDELTRLEQSYG